MKGWAEEMAPALRRWYPRLNEELKSDGYKPAHFITITMSRRYKGVAEANPGSGRILGSVAFFKAHPEDVGAFIHETTHVVQNYHSRRNPGWLVEGLDDYVRYYLFEPGKNRRFNPDRARYNAGYGVTASFLAYVIDTYEKKLVSRLNTIMREGKYSDDVFKEMTGKTLGELDEEWRASLKGVEVGSDQTGAGELTPPRTARGARDLDRAGRARWQGGSRRGRTADQSITPSGPGRTP